VTNKKMLIIYKWNSILLALASIVTALFVLYNTHKFVLPIFLLLSGTLKLIGVLFNIVKLRLWGLIAMNVSWSVLAFWFSRMFSLVAPYAALFAFFITLFGIGIAVQEKFYEH